METDLLTSKEQTNTQGTTSIDDTLSMESTSSVINEDIMKSKQAVIVEFAQLHSAELAAERFGVSRNTVRAWLKQQKIPTKPVYNSPGQGRKITYSRELDAQIAEYTRALLSKQERVTVQDVCTYARKLIQQENPEFTASTGWAQRFLARNNIDLSAQVRKLIPTTRQASSSSSSSPDNRGRPLSYSAETDNLIAEWVKGRTDNGDVVTNSELRKYAKELVTKENANFTGSASWAQNFLLRHRLSLQPSFLNVGHEKYKPTDPMHSVSDTHSVPDTHAVQNLQLMSSQIVCEPSLVTDSRHMTTVSAPLQLVSQNLTTVNNGSLTTTGTNFTGVDDSVTSTLALLTGENLPVEGNLTQAQATALALSDLTSDTALAEILGTAQDPSGSNITAFTQSGLDSSASQLSYLNSLGQHLSDLVVPNVGGAHHGFVGGVVSQTHNTLHSMINHSDMEVLGSGTRPLSYTKETDQALANWVKDQQLAGHKVTFASLRAYAKKLVSSENPNFNASVGWVTPFLLRHNLDLKVNDKRNRPTRKTTHPRKLLSKENPDEDTNLNPPMDDGVELDMQQLSVMPQFSDHTNTPTSMESSSVQLVTQSGDITNETQEKPNIDEFLPPSKRLRVGNRSRHTLAEKLEVVRLMKQFNVAGHYVSRMLGIANSTLSGWIKLVDQKGAELEALSTNRKRSNRTGQGRPLTYSREKDEIIAQWVREQQEMDIPVTASDLTTYATTVIGEENHNFVASVGWRHKFLQRHNLQLVKGDKSVPAEEIQNIPLPVQTEEVCTDEYTPDIIEKVYPDEIDTQLAEWVKDEVLNKGNLSIQNFCKKAEDLIMAVDPMFVATLGWAFKFLHRQNLLLDPKPVNVEICRKRSSSSLATNTVPESQSPKKQNSTSAALMAAAMGISPEGLTISPSTGNLCEALLSLSSQPEQLVINNIRTMQTSSSTDSTSTNTPLSLSSKNYFGKPAREFSGEEKEEVVRYANATTLQKAAIKYGIAAPTIWRWRMELKLHQPKYTANQKKYIVKFAESNSLKDAAQRFGITTKTIQNWKRALQMDGTLSDVEIAAIPPPSIQELTGEIDSEKLTTPTSASGGLITEEVIPLDNSHFQYVVDGGEVAEGSRVQSQVSNPNLPDTPSSSLEVTHEIQVQDVGMEYDVISSEGHAAKPRCTPEEKTHILQYALEHSIKEASVKFGVSPGTLYYWKKNHLAGQKSNQNNITGTKTKSPIYEGSFPSAPPTSLETTIVNVPIPVDIMGNTGIIQSPGGGLDPLQTLTSITDASMLTDTQGTVPTSTLINAITQTLASATPEQLQSLQQITSDLNLLQAVTSLINSQEGNSLRQVITSEVTSRRDSTGGGISSPTDVLVSFHPTETPTSNIITPTHQTDLQVQLQVSSDLPITIEEVTTSSNAATPTEVTMETGNEVTTTEKPKTMEQPET